MSLAQQHRVVIREQHLLLCACYTGQKTDGNIQRATIQRIGNLSQRHGQCLQLYMRSPLM